MARPRTGSIRETKTRDGNVTYSARFTAYGKKRECRIGSTADGMTRAQAERELAFIVADVHRGTWTEDHSAAPAEQPSTEPVPTFHEFASRWFDRRSREWAPSTTNGYRHILETHLLPFFASDRLTDITVQRVDEYRERKLAEGRISGRYINRTIQTLAAILDVADEYELIDRNPCRVNPRNRRVRNVPKPRKVYLDRAAQITALLDGASQLDREARADRRALNRHLLIATLILGGLRIGEALDLKWEHVDLPSGRLQVPGTKTDAADREFRMNPALAEAMRAGKAAAKRTDPGDYVFPTETGAKQDRCHTRSRVLEPAIKIANERLEAEGHPAIPTGKGRGHNLDQHGLRHTHISLRIAVGDDIATIARDVGHADPEITFRVYTHVMSLADAERAELARLLGAFQKGGEVDAGDAAKATAH